MGPPHCFFHPARRLAMKAAARNPPSATVQHHRVDGDLTTMRSQAMRALRALFPSRRLWWRDAASVRRAMRIWLATGSVPVAHMVAELDWTTEFPPTR